MFHFTALFALLQWSGTEHSESLRYACKSIIFFKKRGQYDPIGIRSNTWKGEELNTNTLAI